MVRFEYIMEKEPTPSDKKIGKPNRGKRPPLKVLTEESEISDLISDTPEGYMARIQEREALYDVAFDYLAQVLRATANHQPFSPERGLEIIGEMARIDGDEDPLLIRAIHEDHLEEYPIYHCVNTAVFSIHLARRLGRNEADICRAGLLGLLHDVGFARISEPLLYKEAQLTPDEIESMRRRPLHSHEILISLGASWKWLAHGAIGVYERKDGTGYPNGLAGDAIPDISRIVGLVSLYEALIHSRPQGEKFLFFPAMKWVVKNEKNGFGREYLKAFLSLFTFFPLHSFVRLNTGAVGKVIGTFEEQPMRPKLQMIYDAAGRGIAVERVIDMREHSLLHVIYSVSKDEVAEKIDEESRSR